MPGAGERIHVRQRIQLFFLISAMLSMVHLRSKTCRLKSAVLLKARGAVVAKKSCETSSRRVWGQRPGQLNGSRFT